MSEPDWKARLQAAELRASKAEEREKVLVEALPACVAQLRHAYTHLAKGGVTTQAAFAEGLIAPEIRRLEKLLSETADQALPKDVTRLVIAARRVAYESQDQGDLKELDEAAEVFANRVPWEDEPAPPTTKGEG